MKYKRPLHQRKTSLLRCTAVLRRASSSLQHHASAASRGAQALLRALSLSGGGAAHARAPRRAGWSRFVPYGRALHQREVTLLWCTAALRIACRSLQRQARAAFRVALALLRALSLSLGRRNSTRACGMHAPRCAGWSRCVPYGRALHQPRASLLRCTAVLRRASCGLQRKLSAAAFRVAEASLRPLSLSREKAQHANLRRARAAPRKLRSLRELQKTTAPAKKLSPSEYGRALAYWQQPSTASKRRVSRGAGVTARFLSLGRRRSTRACGVRAPRSVGWSRSMPLGRSLRQREASLLWCTAALQRTDYGLQRKASTASRGAQAPLHSLSLSRGGAARALAKRARRAALVGVGACPMEGHYSSKRPLFFGARPRPDVPAAASNAN